MKKKLFRALLNDSQRDIYEELAKVQARLDTILTDITQMRIELHSSYKDGKEDAIQAAAKIYSRGSGAGEHVTES